MSESYVSASSNEPAADQSGKVDAAKQEASELKDTAASGAKQVAGTAKEEAKNVANEAKYQVKDLYAQGKRELADQASTQQHRAASGLRSVGDELDSMANGTGGSGVAADIVRNVSQRISGAASFLENREPADVLDEVKSFARRRPAVFIGGAVVVGVVVGRLVRALAQNAADENSADTTTGYRAADTAPNYPTDYSSPDLGTGYAGGLPVDAVDSAPSGVYGAGAAGVAAGGLGVAGAADADPLTAEDTPLYAQSTATWEGDLPGEAEGDVRTDSV